MSDTATSPQTPKTPRRLTREEQANEEVGVTDISPRLAKLTIALFLAIILAVPTIDLIRELGSRKSELPRGGKTTEDVRQPVASVQTASSDPIQALSLFSAANRKDLAAAWRRGTPVSDQLSQSIRKTRNPEAGFFTRVLAANKQALKQFDRYEGDQKDETFLAAAIQPMQRLNTRFFKKGNALGIIGADSNWAFLKTGIDYLTGAPFLDPDQLRRREGAHAAWELPPQPNPLLALANLKQALAERDIELLLVPTPVKPQIYPEYLSSRFNSASPLLQNPSWHAFTNEVAELGIHLLDAPTLLHAAKSAGDGLLYLDTDTHWTPDGMEVIGKAIATKVQEITALRRSPQRLFSRYKETVAQLGDVASATLELAGSDIYPLQTVTVQRVETAEADDVPRDDPEAPVVLLGDSFSNIYSSHGAFGKDTGWGDSAGLPETLAFQLQQPVFALCENDNAAHATRRQFHERVLKDAVSGTDFLEGKTIVVYQFAIRELAVGDWKIFDWSKIPKVDGTAAQAPLAAAEITGTIDRISRPPKPGTTPYKNCLVQLLLTNVEKGDGKDCVVYLHGMIDNVWTPAATLKTGQRVKVLVEDWPTAKRKRKLDGLRIEPLELEPDFLLGNPPFYWASSVE